MYLLVKVEGCNLFYWTVCLLFLAVGIWPWVCGPPFVLLLLSLPVSVVDLASATFPCRGVEDKGGFPWLHHVCPGVERLLIIKKLRVGNPTVVFPLGNSVFHSLYAPEGNFSFIHCTPSICCCTYTFLKKDFPVLSMRFLCVWRTW